MFDYLFWLVRPRFIDPMRRINIEAIQNQTVHMSCEATGDPPPRVTWFKRDVELFPPGSFLTSSSAQDLHKTVMPLQGDQILQITNVQKSDAGDYACMASNGGEAIEKKFNLTVISMCSNFVHSFIDYIFNLFLVLHQAFAYSLFPLIICSYEQVSSCCA